MGPAPHPAPAPWAYNAEWLRRTSRTLGPVSAGRYGRGGEETAARSSAAAHAPGAPSATARAFEPPTTDRPDRSRRGALRPARDSPTPGQNRVAGGGTPT